MRLLVVLAGVQLGGACGEDSPGGQTGSAGTTGGAGTSGGGGTGFTGPLPALHVEGPEIKDPNGNKIVLRGVSLIDIGSLWYYASQNIIGITARVDSILAAGFQPHVIRLPVYPRTVVNGGYPAYSPAPFPLGPVAPTGTHLELTNDEYFDQILKPAVDYVTSKGMYVIIDYHQIDSTSGSSATDATTFWEYMAPKFAGSPNVIYEPFNEPIDTSTPWATFKARAQGWIDTIRAAAPDNLIIVPNMIWCQRPGDAASSPPTGSNLLYTAHVYPGNWSAGFKQQVATAVALAPVFFTEWGYVQDGSDKNLGTSDATWGSSFQALVDANGGSWTAWVTDNSWQPAIFDSGAFTSLTAFGTLARDWLAAQVNNDWLK